MQRVDWTNVVNRFVKRFEGEFSTCSKKAHFDCVPHYFAVIDGAGSKWCHLLLFNAIVGILNFESFNLAVRRKFNQQQVLYECLKAEITEKKIGELNEDGSVATITAILDECWHDIKSVRNFLVKNGPLKEKYFGILEHLLGHEALQSRGGDIAKCINAAIAKVLAPTNRKSKQREASTPPDIIRSKRVLAALADTATEPAPAVEDEEPDSQVSKRPRRSPAKKASVPVESDTVPVSLPPKTSRSKAQATTPNLQTPSVTTAREVPRPLPLVLRRAARIYPARRATASLATVRLPHTTERSAPKRSDSATDDASSDKIASTSYSNSTERTQACCQFGTFD